MIPAMHPHAPRDPQPDLALPPPSLLPLRSRLEGRPEAPLCSLIITSTVVAGCHTVVLACPSVCVESLVCACQGPDVWCFNGGSIVREACLCTEVSKVVQSFKCLVIYIFIYLVYLFLVIEQILVTVIQIIFIKCLKFKELKTFIFTLSTWQVFLANLSGTDAAKPCCFVNILFVILQSKLQKAANV